MCGPEKAHIEKYERLHPVFGSILDRFAQEMARPYPTLEEVHFVHEHKPKQKFEPISRILELTMITCPNCGGEQFEGGNPRYCRHCSYELGGMGDETLKLRHVECEIRIDPITGAVDAPKVLEAMP